MTGAAGVDLGSTTVKVVRVGDGRILHRAQAAAGPEPGAAARALLAALPAGVPVLATGYGRDLMELDGLPSITEIRAHALGARFLDPDCTAVVDVGGQDVKVIQLDPAGRVRKFEMNDRCAAGTGRFLEVMAARLGYTLEAFSEAAAAGREGPQVSAMCTVFAESEVVGLLHRGHRREDVALAVHASVARRIAAMFARAGCGPGDRVLFTGGGSRNAHLAALLGERLGVPVRTHPDGPLAGALGCALAAG
jgi:predicted CoA-substrate-specific enzyme activase